MVPAITTPYFVCTVGPDKEPTHVHVTFGDPSLGMYFQSILTVEQARALAADLTKAAQAVTDGVQFIS